MTLEFRAPTEAEWPAFALAMQETFIEDWPEEAAERMLALSDFARPLAGYDGDRVEATGGAYRHQMHVPGATLPCTGITWITVSARHRRRGVLTEMMSRLHQAGAANGEPIAALSAAEGAIYGRFGYGIAARSVSLKAPAGVLEALPPPPGRVVEVSQQAALDRFPALFERASSTRPGAVVRHQAWWERLVSIASRPDPGWAKVRFLVYVDAGGKDQGFASVRLKGHERGLLFRGRCRLFDMHATSSEASAALWRYAGSFDLVSTVTARMRPLDDGLALMLPDPRQVTIKPDEELWLHVLDPVAALEGRRYLRDGHIRFSIDDPAWPAASGTYELEVARGVAHCERSAGPAELDLGSSGLGAIYLGQTSPLELVNAGRAREERPGAAADAHGLFHWAPTAWAPDMW